MVKQLDKALYFKTSRQSKFQIDECFWSPSWQQLPSEPSFKALCFGRLGLRRRKPWLHWSLAARTVLDRMWWRQHRRMCLRRPGVRDRRPVRAEWQHYLPQELGMASLLFSQWWGFTWPIIITWWMINLGVEPNSAMRWTNQSSSYLYCGWFVQLQPIHPLLIELGWLPIKLRKDMSISLVED
jgi:hypothetical protein